MTVKHDTSKSESPVIEVNELKKSFKNNKVLKGISFNLNKGESLVILGRSGGGKSILIKCIIGLIAPDSGNIKVFDKPILKLKQKELDELREKMGFLFQNNALYDSLTIRENLEFTLKIHLQEKDQHKIDKRVKEALDSVGLPNEIDKMPSELSGGMQKRIGLARCLILNPEIMLYDEPTTGLDTITGMEIINLMLDMQKKYKSSSIIITHDMKCAKLTADRILVLIDGIIYATGTYEELEKSKDKKINSFFE